MAVEVSVDVLDERDQRLVAALQYDGRLTAHRAGEVLGLSPRTVQRRWRALMDGTVRVVALPPRPAAIGALLLRIRVLRGKTDAIAAALAAREDVPFIDLSASGDEISAVAWTAPGTRDRLVFRQLPSARAVTDVTAATVLHAFREAADWRHDVLTAAERQALAPPYAAGGTPPDPPDDLDRAVLAALRADARAPAAAVAARTGAPESTVRRRIARLAASGALRTQVVVDVRRLGLAIDANVMMRVPPARLDAVGRALAAHPAVHGAFATTGTANLHAAVWVRGLPHLYRFVSEELGALGVDSAETVIVGQAVKRPGAPAVIG
ncbi:AsnC family transcriptional regulator [Streptomyces sp. B1866]|uniref:AsnC family transcriptional regulator n=1 Tax=Streptomyces sp. B1866 TaxID=3075431 RepID=UPI00288F3E9C|nr:AsnC family transcriptional regulator [Streptomyces sp. B1866]MDT3396383.1 AsnC family transcriptional regulator [Streptomyces sp. B1866]